MLRSSPASSPSCTMRNLPAAGNSGRLTPITCESRPSEPGTTFVQLRSVGDRRVETPQPQQHARLVRPIGDDMRAASDAKPPKLAVRRFEARQQLFAAQPAKRLPRHRHDRRKRGPMGLTAGRAMAMDDRARRSIDLVGDRTAKAATRQHDHLSVQQYAIQAADAVPAPAR